MSIDLSWVTKQLSVGGHYEPDHISELLAHKVRYVVDVRVETCDDERLLQQHGISLLHLPTLDMKAVSQEMLDDAVRWIRPLLATGERVHVHCQHGIGRSALVVLCVLVAEGMAPVDALRLAKDAREKVSPSPEQLGAFTTWCARWKEKTGARYDIPDFETLAIIAYRHLQQSQSEGSSKDVRAGA